VISDLALGIDRHVRLELHFDGEQPGQIAEAGDRPPVMPVVDFPP
jgi:hypothetical protein